MKSNRKMEKNMKIAVIIAVVAAVAIVALALIKFFSQEAMDAEKRGNTVGNVNNFGNVAEEDGALYYFNGGLMRWADGQAVQVADISGGWISVCDGWVYYADYEADSAVCRVRTDGSQRQVLAEQTAKYVSVAAGKVFYVVDEDTDAEENGIYCVNIDGTENRRISKYNASNLFYYGGRLYFTNQKDNKRIYSIDLNGDGAKVVTSTEASCMAIEDGWIYFGGDSGIYKIHPDGTGRKLLIATKASFINATQGRIYWTDYNILASSPTNSGIYSMDRNGGDVQQIYASSTFGVGLAGGSLYFNDMMDGFLLKRIDLSQAQAEPQRMDAGTYNPGAGTADEQPEESAAPPASATPAPAGE